MDYGLYRYDEPYSRPVRRRINYFAWTVAILLLTGFAFAAWLGPGRLYEFYGSTELGVNTVLKPTDVLRKPGSCGRAAPGGDHQGGHAHDEDGDHRHREIPEPQPLTHAGGGRRRRSRGRRG